MVCPKCLIEARKTREEKRIAPGSRGLTTERSEKQREATQASHPALFAQSEELEPVAEGAECDSAEGRLVLVCRNPKCEDCGKVVRVLEV